MKAKLLLFFFILIIAGCPAPQQTATKQEEPSPPIPTEIKPKEPDIILRIGTLDLAPSFKQITSKDADNLAAVIRREKISILAVQGILRYPGIATRFDIVDGLAQAADMRKAFGETIALSGRQNGNAVFSTYPILSSDKKEYSGLKSTSFEGVLYATIDCGVRDIAVASTRLPEKASVEDQSKCMKALADVKKLYGETPIIVGGNLPSSSTMRALAGFQDSFSGNQPAKVWYGNEGLSVLSTKVAESSLGSVRIVEFGLFRKPQP